LPGKNDLARRAFYFRDIDFGCFRGHFSSTVRSRPNNDYAAAA
jgi:hypothetical protein